MCTVRTVRWSLRDVVGMRLDVQGSAPVIRVRPGVGTDVLNHVTICRSCRFQTMKVSWCTWCILIHSIIIHSEFIRYPFLGAHLLAVGHLSLFSFSAPPPSCQSMERDHHTTRYYCSILRSVYPEQQFCSKPIKQPLCWYTIALLNSTNSFQLSGEIPSDSRHAFVSFASGRWWLLLNPAC